MKLLGISLVLAKENAVIRQTHTTCHVPVAANGAKLPNGEDLQHPATELGANWHVHGVGDTCAMHTDE
jgi:hypothetical protein